MINKSLRRCYIITLRSVFVQANGELDTLPPFFYYELLLLLEQVWRGYNQAPEKYSAVNIEIVISRNTKCAIWNGFPRSSHICMFLRMYFVLNTIFKIF